jgi:transglutaminase-like putative cysteine protease
VFIAAARSLGIPARYVGGYFRRDEGLPGQDAGHAWAEGFVPGLGWVAFDTANGLCATDAHVRVAVGLDRLGAAPLRGTHFGGSGEARSVEVRVAQAAQHTQE